MTSRGLSCRSAAAAAAVLALTTACSGSSTPGTSGSSGAAGTGATAGAATPTGASSAPSASAAASGSATPAAAITPAAPVAPPASASPVPDSDAKASGVVRLEVNTCTTMSTATAFFVGADTVLAPAHAVAGANAIAVHSAGGVVRGQVVGSDAASDVAVVKLLPTGDGSRLTGSVFSLASAAPTKGQAITMLGQPVGRHLYRAAGTVQEVGQSATVAGAQHQGLVQHTANAAPGTSGAPLLDAQGRVVAMELATNSDGSGNHYAVPMSTAGALVARWKASPSPVKMASCNTDGMPSMTSIHPDAPAIRAALYRYLTGVSNPAQTMPGGLTGLQQGWYGLGTAAQKQYGSPQKLAAAYQGQKFTAANVDNLEKRDYFTDTLIWTVQFEGPGTKCLVHQQKVVMSSAPGRWVIDSATDVAAPRVC